MAHAIKTVSKFSDDAITMALSTFQKEERMNLEQGLKSLSGKLGKKQNDSKANSESKKPSDDSIFTNTILPQIKRSIQDLEVKELESALQVKLNFALKLNFDDINPEQLKVEHQAILALEGTLQAIMLLVQFSRGKLYLHVAQECYKAGNSFKKYVIEQFSVSYMTVTRYMVLATIISKYPRLLFCNLSFAQILKHRTRLEKYLTSPEGDALHARLGLSVELTVQDQSITINQRDFSSPKVKLSTDPDWAAHDECADDIPNKVFDNWIQSTTDAAENNEIDDLERDLDDFHVKVE